MADVELGDGANGRQVRAAVVFGGEVAAMEAGGRNDIAWPARRSACALSAARIPNASM
jgi:hypothetical protein